jgi:hypothetical protein
VADYCGHGNEPSGFIKGAKFLDKLNECQLLHRNCAVCNLLLCSRSKTHSSFSPKDFESRISLIRWKRFHCDYLVFTDDAAGDFSQADELLKQ